MTATEPHARPGPAAATPPRRAAAGRRVSGRRYRRNWRATAVSSFLQPAAVPARHRRGLRRARRRHDAPRRPPAASTTSSGSRPRCWPSPRCRPAVFDSTLPVLGASSGSGPSSRSRPRRLPRRRSRPAAPRLDDAPAAGQRAVSSGDRGVRRRPSWRARRRAARGVLAGLAVAALVTGVRARRGRGAGVHGPLPVVVLIPMTLFSARSSRSTSCRRGCAGRVGLAAVARRRAVPGPRRWARSACWPRSATPRSSAPGRGRRGGLRRAFRRSSRPVRRTPDAADSGGRAHARLHAAARPAAARAAPRAGRAPSCGATPPRLAAAPG